MLFESSKGILDFFFLNKENQLRACKLGANLVLYAFHVNKAEVILTWV